MDLRAPCGVELSGDAWQRRVRSRGANAIGRKREREGEKKRETGKRHDRESKKDSATMATGFEVK